MGKKRSSAVTVKHPEYFSVVHHKEGGNPITVTDAKTLLGWEEDTGGFGSDYQIIDRKKTKIRLTNNLKNRPVDMPNVESLVQEILTRNWQLNGEAIIIGENGTLLNGQHSLIALVLADQDLHGPNAEHWKQYWDEDIYIEKFINYGVKEMDKVINTMDTCKPRSLKDVIYRSQHFMSMKIGERKVASKIADYCIRMLWMRTGANKDAYTPRKTHSEAMNFILTHPKVLEAVKHILVEDNKKSISNIIHPGYAAACLYLMGTSLSDGDLYRNSERNENILDTSMWDLACEFWTLLSAKSKRLGDLVFAIGALADSRTGIGGTTSEVIGVICKAWELFSHNMEINRNDLVLKKMRTSDNLLIQNEFPEFGGIDFGDPKAATVKILLRNGKPEDEIDDDLDRIDTLEDELDTLEDELAEEYLAERGEDDPTPEELEVRKAKLRNKGNGKQPKLEKDKPKNKSKPTNKKLLLDIEVPNSD